MNKVSFWIKAYRSTGFLAGRKTKNIRLPSAFLVRHESREQKSEDGFEFWTANFATHVDEKHKFELSATFFSVGGDI